MPIQVHGSSPSLVSAYATSVATSSFTPPSGSLLVACVMSKNDGSVALTNTGSALSWTLRIQGIHTNGCSAIYTSSAIAQSMSVTGTMDFFPSEGTQPIAIKIYVLTGADLSDPVGATNSSQSTGVENWTFPAYTSTSPDSWGFCAAADDFQTATPSSSDVAETFNQGGASYLSGMAIRKAAATPAVGTPVSFDIRSGEPSPSTRWGVCAVEIKAAPVAVRGLRGIHRPPIAVHRASSW
ncbi:hypothetical protein ACIBG7_12640 [Nonomuraea sp. NPDC050328]|uniref:hypothetical protein n=1 Tax=Nonomuraea sp. NPDC050328 TaxID=3364361 RepID=UPI0037A41BB9